jgi:N-acetylglucosamine-6-phosphate deacetylase
MTSISVTNGHIVTPDAVLGSARIELADGRIRSIEAGVTGAEAIDLEGGWLMPGFIDTQVNGGGGVLLNDDISVEAIRIIGAAHTRYGTTGFLPTLISDDLDRVAAALNAAEEAIAARVPGVLGVHIEGPFLNPRRKGIHEERKLRLLDNATVSLLTRPRRGKVMLTLAPELCSPETIAALVAGGVIVSAGHTDAGYDQVMAALAAGMSGFTHLFNAMSPLLHREPGAVGAAFDHGKAWCGLIADGVHVHPAALRIAMRILPPDRIMLVSDAMPSVGATDKNFILQGKPISVVDGICVDDSGTLAGTDLDMAQALRTMVTLAGADPVQASRMASANPAAFLGLADECGALAPGQKADFVWLDSALQPRRTWQGGWRI